MNAALQKPPVVDVSGAAAAPSPAISSAAVPRGAWGEERLAVPADDPPRLCLLPPPRHPAHGGPRPSIAPLDDFHVLARTHWWSSCRRTSGDAVEIEFDNICLLAMCGRQRAEDLCLCHGR